MTPRYIVLERNDALRTVHAIGQPHPSYPDAVAAAQARMPDPASFRRYVSIIVRPEMGTSADDVIIRRGEA